jgi:tRNA(fMet)-specific endonuclease VapC
MLRYVLDTDHLTLFERGFPPLLRRFAAESPGSVGLTAVTVQEALRGRLAALSRAPGGPQQYLSYSGLVGTVKPIATFPIVPFEQAADQEYQQLQALRLRIGTQDKRIAATALANRLVVVTRNRRISRRSRDCCSTTGRFDGRRPPFSWAKFPFPSAACDAIRAAPSGVVPSSTPG